MSKSSEKRDPDEIILTRHHREEAKTMTEEEPYDLSIAASIRSNSMAWRQLTELKGAIIASPESAGRDHALKLIDLFDAWFESSDDRLQLMLDRRNKAGGAS